jgi:hypothetical protein
MTTMTPLRVFACEHGWGVVVVRSSPRVSQEKQRKPFGYNQGLMAGRG